MHLCQISLDEMEKYSLSKQMSASPREFKNPNHAQAPPLEISLGGFQALVYIFSPQMIVVYS